MVAFALASTAYSAYQNRQNRSQARKESRTNRRFQAGMSDTAYQRAMIDMKKAGLNPILAGKFGGASTPAGGIAQLGQTFDTTNTAINAIQAESNINKQTAEIEKIQQEIQNYEATERLTDAQTQQVSSLIAELNSRITLQVQQGIQADASAAKLRQERLRLAYQNVYNEVISEFYSGNEWAAIAKEMGTVAAQTAQSIIGAFFANKYGERTETMKRNK